MGFACRHNRHWYLAATANQIGRRTYPIYPHAISLFITVVLFDSVPLCFSNILITTETQRHRGPQRKQMIYAYYFLAAISAWLGLQSLISGVRYVRYVR